LDAAGWPGVFQGRLLPGRLVSPPLVEI